MSADFDKFASDLGYTQDKLAASMQLFARAVDFAEGEDSFAKMADDRLGSLAPLWMLFEKQAESEGYDLPNSPADKVVAAFNDYVKQAEEEAAKGDKKDDKDDKKKEEEQQKKASLHFQKIAYQAQQEELFRHLGEVAADAMLQKLASGGEGPANDASETVGGKLRGLVSKGKDLASKGKDAVVGAAKDHPRAAKGVGAAAGLAAVGGAAAAGYKHFKKKDSDGPASEEKKAFDYLAAQVAVGLAKQAQDNGSKVSLEAVANDLNGVLYKLAQEGGDGESDQVKQASAAGNGTEALNIRACELLSMAGYTWLGCPDARQPLSHRDLFAVEHPDSPAPYAHNACSRDPRTERSRSESRHLACAYGRSSPGRTPFPSSGGNLEDRHQDGPHSDTDDPRPGQGCLPGGGRWPAIEGLPLPRQDGRRPHRGLQHQAGLDVHAGR